jgi:hypothetical protein
MIYDGFCLFFIYLFNPEPYLIGLINNLMSLEERTERHRGGRVGNRKYRIYLQRLEYRNNNDNWNES